MLNLNNDGDSSEEDEVISASNYFMKNGNGSSNGSFSRSVLLQQVDDEEDEDEEPPVPITIQTSISSSSEAVETPQSDECMEALQAIDVDGWDSKSWILFIQEVNEGRGGPSISITNAYSKFLNRFPRAVKYWKAYIDYQLKKSEYTIAEEAFSKCLVKYRSVDIWMSYISMVQMKSVQSGDIKSDEAVFERAIDNVGMSFDSAVLWKTYLEFIRDRQDWHDVGDSRRLAAYRKIYQKALCVPHEGLDTLWKEYEVLEKMVGEHLAEKVLPEYEAKYAHAKAIYRDRKRASSKIEFDRLATPPTNSVSELQQLTYWHKWIRWELLFTSRVYYL